MAFEQNNAQSKKIEQSETLVVMTRANLNKAVDQGKQFVDAAQNGISKMVDLREQATETTKRVMQKGVETASDHAREAADRFTRTLGFSGDNSEHLARQSKQNMEAVARCGTVLTQAFQDVSRSWFGLAQKQFQHNLDGMNKLVRAKSLQEFTAIQSDLMRESLQHMVQDSKAITETSARAVEEASKTFSSVGPQSPAVIR